MSYHVVKKLNTTEYTWMKNLYLKNKLQNTRRELDNFQRTVLDAKQKQPAVIGQDHGDQGSVHTIYYLEK